MILDTPTYPGYERRVQEVERWYMQAMYDWLADGGGQAALDALQVELERQMILAALPPDPPTPQYLARQVSAPAARRRWRFSFARLTTEGAQ